MYAGADIVTHFSFRPDFCTLGTPVVKCTLASGTWQRIAVWVLDALMAMALDVFMVCIADLRAML